MAERQAPPGDATTADTDAADHDEPTVETTQRLMPAGNAPVPASPSPRPRPARSDAPAAPADDQAAGDGQEQPAAGTAAEDTAGVPPGPTRDENSAATAAAPTGTSEEQPSTTVQPAPDATSDDDDTVDTAVPAPPDPAAANDAEQTVVIPRGDHGNAWFEPWADDPTQVLPLPAAADPSGPGAHGDQSTRPVSSPNPVKQAPISHAMASVDPVTERLPLPAAPQGGPPPPEGPAPDASDAREEPAEPRRRGGRLAMVIGGLLVLAGLVYGGDLLLSQGSVPRGVTVAGVPVGGLDPAAAEQRLRGEITPRTTRPIAVRLGEARSSIDPVAAGLSVDWTVTLTAVSEQPLNPITRLTSLFSTREVPVVTAVDGTKLEAALNELAPTVNRPAREGTVEFDGITPRGVDPEPGQQLDVPAAVESVRRDWVSGGEVALPLTSIPPITTAAGVAKAVDLVARPAVASPFTVTGEAGTSLTLVPQQIASVLAFRPGTDGDLIGEVNPSALEQAAGPAFASSERPGRDASIDIATGVPMVVPSQDGRGVDYQATAVAMGPPLISAGQRQVAAVYAEEPAELTTEKLTALGITGLVSEFTTRGFAADSGRNIRRAAEQVNGTVVEPGETFSLNAVTNPRDASNGYVEAGIIEDGHPSRGVGGGVSQMATTLFNAAYFAGLTLVEHKEHSFYISRYPAGREATVFNNIIDLKFRNNSPTAIMIQTVWTPQSITVRIFGTKYYEVMSATGPRTAPTEPKTVTIPSGEPCSPSRGAPGFTVTDTRTLRDLKTGEVRSDPVHTVRYNPSPIVECGG